ncbi:MAG: 23S rRNA (uracil(1939)-C(5))-methyltransferase RlmD [Deltaproteobacteria bacterium]|nr:23S rRNA (uracil(1939)-C(5))-methyltransferase RlmD [Deltaproteobacteria bacterium]
MEIGDRKEIRIDTIAFGGDGIGKIGDLVVFVPFTAEGDLCEISVRTVKKNYLTGHLKKLLQASPLRTEPLCPYYTLCGGCQYQHMGYQHQLAAKQDQILDTFERIGKIKAPDIRAIIPSPKIYRYRGKADFQVYHPKGKRPLVGFVDTSGNAVIPIERCEIVEESINQTLADLKRDLATHNIRLTSDRQTIWSDSHTDIASAQYNTVRSSRYVERIVKGKRFQVPYGGFFQINTALVDTLVDTVEKMCGLTGIENVLDAYCGSGLFSIFLASRAKRIYGIDSDAPAIHCAGINGQNNGMDHLAFYQGDAADIMKTEFVQAKTAVDRIILDPPRSGCEKDVLDAVVALKPEKVIYISCNPATQARDIRYLLDRGIVMKYIQPLDMFPQTQHIEAVALLETG